MNFFKTIYHKFLYNENNETYSYCRRCGKRLKTHESKKLGLGKCCYKKELYKNKLF